MALSLFIKDMNIIAPLDTLPNDRGGFSPDMLKGKFDEGGIALKNYINLILIPEIESLIEAASQGVSPGSGIDGMIIVDASIHTRKLAGGAVTSAKIADGAVATGKIADGAVTAAKIAPKSIGRAQLEDEAIMLQSTDFPNKVVPERALADGAASTVKIADGAVTAAKLAGGAVAAAKLAADAKSKGVAVTLSVAGWSSNTQTVSVSGVTADNNVLVAAAPASRTAYNDAEIYCSAQAAGTLTFACGTAPSEDITVNVVILV